MGDGALTKAQLDELTIEWKRWRADIGAPVEQFNKAMGRSVATATEPRGAALVKALNNALDSIPPVIHELEKQVAALTARVAELERKGYVGVWKSEREYSPQSEVTHDGARWISHKRTSDRPGVSADWTMIEKSAPTASARSDASATAHARNGSTLPPSNPRRP